MRCKRSGFSFVKKTPKGWSAEKLRLAKSRPRISMNTLIIIFNTFRTELPSKIKQNKKQNQREGGRNWGEMERRREGGRSWEEGRKEGRESRKREEKTGERTSVLSGLFSLPLNPRPGKMYLPVEVWVGWLTCFGFGMLTLQTWLTLYNGQS